MNRVKKIELGKATFTRNTLPRDRMTRELLVEGEKGKGMKTRLFCYICILTTAQMAKSPKVRKNGDERSTGTQFAVVLLY